MFINARSIEELMCSNEPLLPELQPYVIETHIGKYIKHPLIVMPLFSNALINEKYKFIREREQEKPYNISIYERAFRLLKLIEFWRNKDLDDNQLRKELSWVWPDMEGDDSLSDKFIREEVLPLFKHLEFTSDSKKLIRPKHSLNIYRGGMPDGIAWSTDLNIAKWFATRFAENNPVYKAIVLSEHILGRFNDRNEYEVIVDPRNLCNVELVEEGDELTEDQVTNRKQHIPHAIFEVENHRP